MDKNYPAEMFKGFSFAWDPKKSEEQFLFESIDVIHGSSGPSENYKNKRKNRVVVNFFLWMKEVQGLPANLIDKKIIVRWKHEAKKYLTIIGPDDSDRSVDSTVPVSCRPDRSAIFNGSMDNSCIACDYQMLQVLFPFPPLLLSSVFLSFAPFLYFPSFPLPLRFPLFSSLPLPFLYFLNRPFAYCTCFSLICWKLSFSFPIFLQNQDCKGQRVRFLENLMKENERTTWETTQYSPFCYFFHIFERRKEKLKGRGEWGNKQDRKSLIFDARPITFTLLAVGSDKKLITIGKVDIDLSNFSFHKFENTQIFTFDGSSGATLVLSILCSWKIFNGDYVDNYEEKAKASAHRKSFHQKIVSS